MHILVTCAQFYPDITKLLLEGARETLKKYDATWEEIDVPGAFEIPPAIRFGMTNKKYDGFVALGCVIRGETAHFDYVCSESARGLMELSLKYSAAIGYGILTVETLEQAKIRAHIDQGNKGRDAAIACIKLIELKRKFGVI